MTKININKTLIIGICADAQQQGAHVYHQAGDKYIRALTSVGENIVPFILPALFHELSTAAQQRLLSTLDGVMLTGSYSNLDPSYYLQGHILSDDQRDPQRDASNWLLIEKLLDAKLPILGICRGFQELNVYFGGTLHHRVHEVVGMQDHREDKLQSLDSQYDYAHTVALNDKGLLTEWFAPRREIRVNSIHMQGIEKLGQGLQIEAKAADGLVEAFSLADYPFLLAVQWHPEWRPDQYADNRRIIQGFIDACHELAPGNRQND
jgi:putative glutamine amidotransferase